MLLFTMTFKYIQQEEQITYLFMCIFLQFVIDFESVMFGVDRLPKILAVRHMFVFVPLNESC
jgi:hypothetical protein